MEPTTRTIKVECESYMYERPENLKTRISECNNEFEQRFKERQAPPPNIVRGVPNLPVDYNVLDEIRRVHQLIKQHGEQGDFGMQMTFGNLLQLYGTDQADKLSEILANARKNGFVNYTVKGFFEQDRDEDVFIRLVKTPF